MYEKIFHKHEEISQKQLTRLSRLVVFIVVIFAVLLAFMVREEILWFVLFAWAGLGAAIGPTSLLALFWKRTTRTGVISGLICGTAIVFIWKSTGFLNNLLYELVPAFFLAMAVTIIVSLVTSDRIND